MRDLPYAEDINYWKTSQSAPETWVERAVEQIEKIGGKVYSHAFGKDDRGNSAYMILCEIGGHRFKIIWPVLQSKGDNIRAAKRQAATLLFHDVKAKCLSSTVIGSRRAFFQYMMLPDGRTADQASMPELAEGIPGVINQLSLPSGEEE